jgi:hypothetical protein
MGYCIMSKKKDKIIRVRVSKDVLEEITSNYKCISEYVRSLIEASLRSSKEPRAVAV